MPLILTTDIYLILQTDLIVLLFMLHISHAACHIMSIALWPPLTLSKKCLNILDLCYFYQKSYYNLWPFFQIPDCTPWTVPVCHTAHLKMVDLKLKNVLCFLCFVFLSNCSFVCWPDVSSCMQVQTTCGRSSVPWPTCYRCYRSAVSWNWPSECWSTRTAAACSTSPQTSWI